MKKLFYIILFIALVISNNLSQTNSSLNQMEPEEYRLYSSRLIGGKTKAYLNQTILIRVPEDILKKIPNLSAGTLKDFDIKNRTSALIEDKFSIRNRYTLLDKAEFQKIVDLFIKEGVDASPQLPLLIRLSRIGFNRDKTQALLFENYYYGPVRCGNTPSNFFVLYEKKDGYWEIAGGYAHYKNISSQKL